MKRTSAILQEAYRRWVCSTLIPYFTEPIQVLGQENQASANRIVNITGNEMASDHENAGNEGIDDGSSVAGKGVNGGDNSDDDIKTNPSIMAIREGLTAADDGVNYKAYYNRQRRQHSPSKAIQRLLSLAELHSEQVSAMETADVVIENPVRQQQLEAVNKVLKLRNQRHAKRRQASADTGKAHLTKDPLRGYDSVHVAMQTFEIPNR